MAMTLLQAHVLLPDPHGDRAYADAKFVPLEGGAVGVSQTADKPTDENRTSIVLVDDASLSIPVTGNARYTVEAFLIVDGDPDAGMTLTFTAPSDASGSWVTMAATAPVVTGGTSEVQLTPLAFGEPASVGVSQGGVIVPPKGSLITASLSGFLTLQWAPTTTPASPLFLRAGSWLLLRRTA